MPVTLQWLLACFSDLSAETASLHCQPTINWYSTQSDYTSSLQLPNRVEASLLRELCIDSSRSGAEVAHSLQGPTAREARRDTTAFDAARAEWGKAELSIKGGVGQEGDHRSEVWLG